MVGIYLFTTSVAIRALLIPSWLVEQVHVHTHLPILFLKLADEHWSRRVVILFSPLMHWWSLILLRRIWEWLHFESRIFYCFFLENVALQISFCRVLFSSCRFLNFQRKNGRQSVLHPLAVFICLCFTITCLSNPSNIFAQYCSNAVFKQHYCSFINFLLHVAVWRSSLE